jgi:hypothetical protein
MKILAIEKSNPGIGSSDFASLLKAEALMVLELYEIGIIREIYFNQQHDAVIIMECEDLDIANEILGTLPLVQNGLIYFELMELSPYTGFSRLIK